MAFAAPDAAAARRDLRLFGAACHYKDGTFTFTASQDQCAKRSPQTGAPCNSWHPELVTLHVWIWYPNPDGLYNSTNSLIRPFNGF